MGREIRALLSGISDGLLNLGRALSPAHSLDNRAACLDADRAAFCGG